MKKFREVLRRHFNLGDVLRPCCLAGSNAPIIGAGSRTPPTVSCSIRPPPDEAVSIDCETTGLDVRKDDIVTIAAVKINGNRILTSEKFEAVVRPAAKMNPEAIKMHRLRERDVAMGRAMAEVLPPLLHFIGVAAAGRLSISNSTCAMINRYLRRWLGIELPNPRDRGFRTLLRAQIRQRAAGNPCRSDVSGRSWRTSSCPFSTNTTPMRTR